MKLPPHQFITSPRDWQACLTQLRQEPRLAIDLEANSMYAYREQVCLIQISIPGQDFLLDPLSPIDLSGLGELIGDTAVEKVFHAAEYDLMLLKRQYDWQLHNLFDTMWAARILGYQKFGLASLLNRFYQIKLDKRFQKSDWCRRPLSPEQRRYAQLDTHHLLRLRDDLAQKLKNAHCLEEAQEIFEEQTHVSANHHPFDPDDFWGISGVRDLDGRGRAVLKALNIYRNDEAAARNKPLFKVLNNRTLIDLAANTPRNMTELRQIYGMSSGQIRRYGYQLLRVIEKSKNTSPPKRPRQGKRPSDAVLNRYERLHSWRKNRAQKRGVESDVIISRDALWAIAEANPQNLEDLAQISCLGEWRRARYGDEILKVMNKSSRRRRS